MPIYRTVLAIIFSTSMLAMPSCQPVIAQSNRNPAGASSSPPQLSESQRQDLLQALELVVEVGQLNSQGSFAKAVPIAERMVDLFEKVYQDDAKSMIPYRSTLAATYASAGQLLDAERIFQQILKIKDTASDDNAVLYGMNLCNLANVKRDRGDFVGAEVEFDRSIGFLETRFGNGNRHLMLPFNNKGVMYQEIGQYSKAIEMFNKSMQVAKTNNGEDSPGFAMTLLNIADSNYSIGNIKESIAGFQRALSIFEKHMAEHAYTATCMNGLAKALESQDDFVNAAPLRSKALAMRMKVSGLSHPDTLSSISFFARALANAGDYAVAEDLYQSVIRKLMEELGEEHARVAESQDNLASIYAESGNKELARLYASIALRAFDKSLGVEHPDTTLCATNLAIYEESFDVERARQVMDRARRGSFAFATKTLASLSDSEQRAFIRSGYTRNLHVAYSMALRHSENQPSIELSAGWVINGKGLVQEVLAQRSLLTRDDNNELIAPSVERLLEIQRQLARFSVTGQARSSEGQTVDHVLAMEAEKATLEKSIAMKTGQEVTGLSWVDLEDVRRSLGIRSILIDIVRFEPYDFEHKKGGNPWQPARYAAWMIPPAGDSLPRMVDLGSADEIDDLIERVRTRIQADGLNDGIITKSGEANALAELDTTIRQLRTRIWDPIEPFIGETNELIVSPDGALWLAPWAALPVGEQQDVLISKYAIRFVLNGRQLAKKQSVNSDIAKSSVFANPDFDCSAAAKKSTMMEVFKSIPKVDLETMRGVSAKNTLPKVVPLPNTATEAQLISKSLEQMGGNAPEVYLGRMALESIAKALSRPRVAVFATHGYFLPGEDRKLEGVLHHDAEGKQFHSKADGSFVNENPLLRCGLMFTGSNLRQVAVGDDDGILTGMEITSIDLRGTDMVVLSACETGVGDVRNGEGVAGLRQAFQLAGAKSVVSTLWQIPDRDSAIIMNDFFANVASGQSKSEAMRQAQLKRIQSRTSRYGAAHPLYWAAWTVTE